MNGEPRVTVKVPDEDRKSRMITHTIYGRKALEFVVWWRTPEPLMPKVDFYPSGKGEVGATFVTLAKGARGAFQRHQLVVNTNIPD